MKPITLNKPIRSKKPKRINVAFGYRHHKKLKGFSRRHGCNHQQAGELATEALVIIEQAGRLDELLKAHTETKSGR